MPEPSLPRHDQERQDRCLGATSASRQTPTRRLTYAEAARRIAVTRAIPSVLWLPRVPYFGSWRRAMFSRNSWRTRSTSQRAWPPGVT